MTETQGLIGRRNALDKLRAAGQRQLFWIAGEAYLPVLEGATDLCRRDPALARMEEVPSGDRLRANGWETPVIGMERF